MAKQSEATLLLKIKAEGEEALGRIGDALKTVGKVATAAYGVLSGAVVAATHAYREQEEATNSLNRALIQNGIYSEDLSKSYQDMAKELQGLTTFGDEAIVAAQAQVQMYIGQEKVTKDLTKAILDFATAQKMDLSSAAELVGKSIGGSTNMLRRHKVEIDETATVAEKLTQVTAGLEHKFGGQAEAAAGGLGALTQMKVALEDVLEAAGERLAPTLIQAAHAMTAMAQSVENNKSVMDGFVQVIHLAAQGGAVIKNVFASVAQVLGATLGTAVGATTQLINGQFKMAFETIKGGFATMGQEVTQNYSQLHTDLEAIDAAFTERKVAQDEAEMTRLQETSLRRNEILQGEIITREQLFAARDANELQTLMAQENLKNDAYLQSITKRIANEQNMTAKLQLEYEKRKYLDDKLKNEVVANAIARGDIEAGLNSKRAQEFNNTLSYMSRMQNSKSKELVAIGKAAAIAQITTDTAKAAIGAVASMSSIPFVGPALGFAAAGAIIAYGAEQIATVAGVQLAEGGIVKATPGGVSTIIGEGGRDEAVIPLENGMPVGGLGGSTYIVNVYGGLLGDESTAKQLAMALDRQMLLLRQSNESLAFDQGVI